jgi:hypothetical protein
LVSGANRVPRWRAGLATVDAAGGAPRPKDSHSDEGAKPNFCANYIYDNEGGRLYRVSQNTANGRRDFSTPELARTRLFGFSPQSRGVEETKKGAEAAGGFTVDLLKDLAKGFLKKQIDLQPPMSVL